MAPARSIKPGRRNGGFTLIEVLLAISLMAIIMAMAYGGFRAGVRATTSGEELIEETNRLRVAHEFVGRQLSLAQPLIIEETEDGHIRFEGEGDRVRYIAPMPGYLSYGGAYVQELRLESGREGMDLVFAWAILNGYEPGDLDQVDAVTLIEGIDAGSFEYLGFTEDGEELFWTDYWERPDTMPVGVALRMDLIRDNGLFWPELVTPLKIDAASSQPRRVLPQDILDPASRHRGDDQRRERQ